VSKEARDLWGRAVQAWKTAKALGAMDPDAAASRAYYAAFYAASAVLVWQGKNYSKHSGVEAAVHRDLVKTGLWPQELGRGYSSLFKLRTTGDYGREMHVAGEEVKTALVTARKILEAAQQMNPELFSDPPIPPP